MFECLLLQGVSIVNHKAKDKKKSNTYWIINIFLITLLVGTVLSTASEMVIGSIKTVGTIFLLIFCVIVLGIIFDTIGVAVTAADPIPFISLASKKKKGAKIALGLIKNADKVSALCNDVVGDICGILSGAAGGVLAVWLMANSSRYNYAGVIVSGFIAAFTVAGKAAGKSYAIANSKSILLAVGVILESLQSFFKTKR